MGENFSQTISLNKTGISTLKIQARLMDQDTILDSQEETYTVSVGFDAIRVINLNSTSVQVELDDFNNKKIYIKKLSDGSEIEVGLTSNTYINNSLIANE